MPPPLPPPVPHPSPSPCSLPGGPARQGGIRWGFGVCVCVVPWAAAAPPSNHRRWLTSLLCRRHHHQAALRSCCHGSQVLYTHIHTHTQPLRGSAHSCNTIPICCITMPYSPSPPPSPSSSIPRCRFCFVPSAASRFCCWFTCCSPLGSTHTRAAVKIQVSFVCFCFCTSFECID